MTKNEDIVRLLWTAFDKATFSDLYHLLADNFICEWVQSGERIRGADNFIAINENYPGRWHIKLRTLISNGDQVVTEADVYNDETTVIAISFFTLKDGKITHIREFWPDSMEAQTWRKQWVEMIEKE
ncbi:MAG: nuclear transport factor 2 family protein [Phototrophicaceae bacterium]